MPTITRFEDIHAWQTGRSLNRYIYRLTRRRPFANDLALVLQIRRATISIISNIAEGFESRTQRQFIEYLGRAKASCGEVRAQAYAALDAEYISDDEFQLLKAEAERCSKQLANFIQYLESHPESGRVREARVEYVVDSQPEVDEPLL